jgi:hypothetical protein
MGTAAAIAGAAALVIAAPAGAATATTYGDPTGDAKFWAQQSYEDDCGLMAVADIVGRLTGHPVSEADIVSAAGKLPSDWRNGPIYTAPTSAGHDRFGADDRDLVGLFAHYGVDSDLSIGEPDALSTLEQALGARRGVVAFVNSETLWNQTGGDHTDSDHSVVVTGIDLGADPAHSTVHLNDSGRADGADEQVSLQTFQQAWSEQAMIVTA